MCPTDATWAETAWNGIFLRHPASWNVARIAPDQIQWSDDALATLEIHWAPHRGAYDEARVLRRIGKRARRKGLPAPTPWQAPQTWTASLSAYRVTGFIWRRSEADGCGLLIYCPQCRRLSLLQIHPPLTQHPESIPRLLASFNDHPSGAETPLALFGVRAQLPAGAKLHRFRFETGRYRLLWRKARIRIGLHRWAPAAAILDQTPLLSFIQNQFSVPAAGLTVTERGGEQVVDGIWSAGGPLPIRWQRFRFQRYLRVRHTPPHNSLLGIEVSGRGRGLGPLFERLAETYETYC